MSGKSSDPSANHIKLTVNERNYFRRVDKFLRKALKDLSLGRIYFLLRKGRVRVNGKRVRKPSHELNIGDEVSVEVPSDFFDHNKNEKGEILIPRKMNLDILYEDDHILVISKPPGVPIHPGKKTYGPTLIEGLMYYGEKKNFEPFLVHRLDKHTSGVLIVAKNRKTARLLGEMMRRRKIHKEYLALVEGGIETGGRIELDLDGQPAKTWYEPLRFFQRASVSLLKVKIKTGRKHQIRRHMSSMGHPIVGDDLYGDREFNLYFRKKYGLRRYFLHAITVRLVHPISLEEMTFRSPLPDDLKKVIENLEEG